MGKLNIREITNFFESKADGKINKGRGQNSSLVIPTNESRHRKNTAPQPSPEMALSTWHGIGGGLEGASQPMRDKDTKFDKIPVGDIA